MIYERFPGIEKCLWMMRRRNPQIQEDGFGALLPHAAEHVQRLIREFHLEEDHGLRCWLLELIGEAKSIEAFPLLAEQLASSDESFRGWAAIGLHNLDTKEARRLLWEASSWTLSDEGETIRFREELARLRTRHRPE